MEPSHQLTVRIALALIERTKIRAAKERITLQELTTRALEAYLRTPLKREES
jgi:hypothetical protein